MSLNRYEQALFDYWQTQPDERRHWQAKLNPGTGNTTPPGETARMLERELWEYLVERRPHVPSLREKLPSDNSRVSLLNLAEHLLRLWGPARKSKQPSEVPRHTEFS